MRKFFIHAITLILFSIPCFAGQNTVAEKIRITTNQGSIVLELYPDKAPLTVANFLRYVDDDFYSATIFHRVIKDFMIQGGGMGADYKEKATRAPVKNESDNGVSNTRGTIAMARTADPHSASSQFFINVKDNTFLDFSKNGWGYTVFGKVIEGISIADKISQLATGAAGPFSQDAPQNVVVIKHIQRLSTKSPKRPKSQQKQSAGSAQKG